ncbi:MAG: response regulator [Alphaproteobacteria bacterium]|nr:response regulator [Alphaproteobacteria bacterium]
MIVDDAPSALALYRARLVSDYDVDVVNSAFGAVTMIRDAKPPYHVIISDQVMPDMDGLALLRQVKKLSPSTIRILLTGAADLDLAQRAVNEGQVFRFLQKDTKSDGLGAAVAAAIREYHKRVAQADMMQQVMGASVRLLLEVMSAVNPRLARRCMASRRIAMRLARESGKVDPMEVSLAVILASIARMTVPEMTLEELHDGDLSTDGRADIERAHKLVSELLDDVPRLATVSETISQCVSIENAKSPAAQIVWLSEQIPNRRDNDKLDWLGSYRDGLDPEVYQAATLIGWAEHQRRPGMKLVAGSAANLLPGDILDEDVTTGRDKRLILARGQPLTPNLIERLRLVLGPARRSTTIKVLRPDCV